MSFDDHANRILARDENSAERRIFMRDHIQVKGVRMPYMDAINEYMRRRPDVPSDNYYHVAEVPNLGALYLANFLRARGCSAEYVSLFSAEKRRIAAILEERAPRLVAITTTFYILPWPVEEIAHFVREHSPDTKVVAGGPLINNLAGDLTSSALQEVLQFMDADFYVKESQGEDTLLRLVQALREDTDLARVPNIYLRSGSSYRFTRMRPETNVLDECAINWDQFSDDELGTVVQTRTARSCAYKCSFCDFPVRAGALSLASIETVERELALMSRRGIKHVVFIDDTFNVPGPRFKQLCRMMIKNDFGFSWYSFFRCAAARDTETYDLLAASGCKAVFLGIESGDQDVLDNMSKVATLDRYRRGIDELHSRGVTTFGAFISGFPGETWESVENTISFIKQTKPTFYRVEPFWYNHRSPIHADAEKYELTGQAYEWKHKSMDVTGACDAMDAIFANVTDSLWMPLYNFDFWSVPYLLGKGLQMDQVVKFHTLGRDLMRLNDHSTWDSQAQATASATDQALTELFSSVTMTGAKYQVPQ
jgi:p-methyltransferase